MQRDVLLIFGKTGSGKSTLAKSIINNYSRVIVIDSMEEYPGLVLENTQDALRYFQEDPQEFFVAGRFPDPEDAAYLARVAWAVGDCLLVIEEADRYLGSSSYADPNNPFMRLVTRGRHRKVSILAITQRPYLISINLRSQVTDAITFRQDEPRDIDYLEAWGFDPEEISSLSQFSFVSLNGLTYNGSSVSEKE